MERDDRAGPGGGVTAECKNGLCEKRATEAQVKERFWENFIQRI